MLTHALLQQPGDDAEPGELTRAPAVCEFERDLTIAFSTQPHQVSPKYFYDAEGSQWFDRICELPEYYPTRTELALLAQHAPEIAALAGPHAEVVEFGAGSLHKVRLLLRAFDGPARYLPVTSRAIICRVPQRCCAPSFRGSMCGR